MVMVVVSGWWSHVRTCVVFSCVWGVGACGGAGHEQERATPPSEAHSCFSPNDMLYMQGIVLLVMIQDQCHSGLLQAVRHLANTACWLGCSCGFWRWCGLVRHIVPSTLRYKTCANRP